VRPRASACSVGLRKLAGTNLGCQKVGVGHGPDEPESVMVFRRLVSAFAHFGFEKSDCRNQNRTRAYHRLFDSRFVAPGYSRASGPQSGTRRGLTRAFRIGPVTNQVAPTRPPQAPEHRMRRNTCPTVLSRP
jgi:hypothetical protein